MKTLIQYVYVVEMLRDGDRERHPYIAGVIVFPNGKRVYISQMPTDNQEQQAWLTMAQRTVIEDLKFALDFLTDLNDQNPQFLGSMNLSNVGVYGHSFGGGATAACCNEDPRFKAGLTLDGFFSSNMISDGFSTPFLMMVTEDRYVSDNSLSAIWENMTHDAYLVGINGSQHYSFTDVGVLLEHLLPRVPAEILGFGTINQKRMVNITISIERAFFDVYLKQGSSEELIDLLSYYQEISYKMK